MEPLLRRHPDERPPYLERPLDNVNLNKNELISTPDKRPPLLKGHFSDAKGVASPEGSTVYENSVILPVCIMSKRLVSFYIALKCNLDHHSNFLLAHSQISNSVSTE